jgi:hypothetical protein
MEETMSLNYELTRIKDWKSRCLIDDNRLNPVTEYLIFATMSTGIGEITEKNYIEFFIRLKADDAISPWPKGEIDITLQNVRDHIGLRTNVFPNESRSKWVKRVFDSAVREYEYRIRRNEEKKEAA